MRAPPNSLGSGQWMNDTTGERLHHRPTIANRRLLLELSTGAASQQWLNLAPCLRTPAGCIRLPRTGASLLSGRPGADHYALVRLEAGQPRVGDRRGHRPGWADEFEDGRRPRG